MSNLNRKHTPHEVLICCSAVDRWCAAKWDVNNPRGSLRTLSIAPDVFSFDHHSAVDGVMRGREHQLAEESLFSPQPVLPRGRLLIYDPRGNVQDGLVVAETRGFFDSNDCPPWDLWVGCVQEAGNSFLLCWIPDYLEALVQSAVNITCCNSLYWLNESDLLWAEEFRS